MSMNNAIKMLAQRIRLLQAILRRMTEGEIQQDFALLRHLGNLTSLLPAVDSQEFHEQFLVEYNDALLSTYLASITKEITAFDSLLSKYLVVNEKFPDFCTFRRPVAFNLFIFGSHQEHAEGLRIDGRRALDLRHIHIKLGVVENADGSAYFEQGNTKMLVAVYGPQEPSLRSQRQSDRVGISVEYAKSTFSTSERVRRTKGTRRTAEVELAVRQTFEAAAVSTLSPGSQIDIYIQLLQSDGGELCAAINATTLALCDAGIPLSQLVCACSAGLLENTVVLDLNYTEQKADPVILPVAMMPNTEKVTMLRMDSKLDLQLLEQVLRTALEGSKIIHGIMSAHIKEHLSRQLSHSGLI